MRGVVLLCAKPKEDNPCHQDYNKGNELDYGPKQSQNKVDRANKIRREIEHQVKADVVAHLAATPKHPTKHKAHRPCIDPLHEVHVQNAKKRGLNEVRDPKTRRGNLHRADIAQGKARAATADSFTPRFAPLGANRAQGKLEHETAAGDFLGNGGAHGNHQKRNDTQLARRPIAHHLVIALFKRGK